MGFHVKTYLAPSTVQGIGVFAGEDIPKGTLVWKFDPPIDQKFDQSVIDSLPDHLRHFMDRYGYYDQNAKGYILCGDNARFVNHADTPNVEGAYPPGQSPEGIDIANRDIKQGEEIFSDYASFHAKLI